MSKQSVKTTINDNIKQNGHQEITGQIMNSVLNEMVDNLAEEASTTEKLTELEDNTAEHIAHNVVDTNDELYIVGKIINSSGGYYPDTYTGYVTTGYIPCRASMKFRPAKIETNFTPYVCFFNADKTAISSAFINRSIAYIEVPSDANIAYMRVSMQASILNGCLYNSSLTINAVVGYNEVAVKADAVDGTKYVIVDDRLTTLESWVASHQFDILENIFDPSTIIDGKYVNPPDGSILSADTNFITDYFPCKAGDVFVWQFSVAGGPLCALYDADKNFIKGYYTSSLKPFTTIPDIANVAFVRFSPDISYKTRALYRANHAVSMFVPYGKKVLVIDDVYSGDVSLLALAERVSDLERMSATYVTNEIDTSDENYTLNKILNSIGGFYGETYTGYATSGFIPCEAGDVFKIKNGSRFVRWVCFYNASKVSSAAYYINGKSGDSIVVPTAASNPIVYIRVSYVRNVTSDCLYKTDRNIPFVVPYGEMVAINDNMVAGKADFSELTISGVNPFVERIKWEYACGRIICIGDSLTDGYYVVDGSNTKYINENYPYYLGRMLNAEVFNAGRGGSCPSRFMVGAYGYTAWYPLIDFSAYDSVLIWFGTNGGLATADESYAVETPEKEGWYYRQLIDGILSQNPTIKITLGTVFVTGPLQSHITPANVATTNAYIRSVAEEYNLQVVDFSDLVPSQTTDLRNGVAETHFGKAGNIFLADRIYKEWQKWFDADHLRCEFGLTKKQSHNP